MPPAGLFDQRRRLFAGSDYCWLSGPSSEERIETRQVEPPFGVIQAFLNENLS